MSFVYIAIIGISVITIGAGIGLVVEFIKAK